MDEWGDKQSGEELEAQQPFCYPKALKIENYEHFKVKKFWGYVKSKIRT